jgi:hypothetical protein
VDDFRRPTGSLLLALVAAVGCADEAPVPAKDPSSASPAYAPPPQVALLARLRADNPMALRDAARTVAATGDAGTRAAASSILVMQANLVTSQAFRSTSRAVLTSSPEQQALVGGELEAAVDRDRDATLVEVLAAMELIGGRDAVAYCFALAENDAAPLSLRKAALGVLLRQADRNDPGARARAAAAWDRVNATAAATAEHPVPNARDVVAGMAAGFRRCYNVGLRENPSMRGSVRVTARLDAAGRVLATEPSGSGLSESVVACVVARVQAAQFAPPTGGAATIVIPVTFVSK